MLSDETTWTAFPVTFIPLRTGWAHLQVYLKKYEASKGCYIDVNPVVTGEGSMAAHAWSAGRPAAVPNANVPAVGDVRKDTAYGTGDVARTGTLEEGSSAKARKHVLNDFNRN